MLAIGNSGETSQLPAGAMMEGLSTSCAPPCWSLPSFSSLNISSNILANDGDQQSWALMLSWFQKPHVLPLLLNMDSELHLSITPLPRHLKPKSPWSLPLSLDWYDVNVLVWQARPLRSRRDQSERPFLYTGHVAIGSPHRGFSFLFLFSGSSGSSLLHAGFPLVVVSGGYSLVANHRLFAAVASLVAERRL